MDLHEPLIVERKSVLWNVAIYIITTEFCERLCYYGFAGSLVLFFESTMNLSSSDAINQFQLWSGCVYVTPLIGGFIADAYLGRYKTLLVFSGIYLLGLVLFIFGAVPNAINAPLIYLAMYVIALGSGGIKPNASTMGADQFDLRHSRDRAEAPKFFAFFYFSINLGALLSYTVVSYIAQYGIASLGGKNYGFLCAVSLQTFVLASGILVFVSGSSFYVKKQPTESMIGTSLGIFCQALYRPRPAQVTRQLSSATVKYTRLSPSEVVFEDPPQYHWLDKAMHAHGGSYPHNTVLSLKLMLKLTPFLVTFVCYWAVYSQTKTSFQLQSCQCNLHLGDFEVPVSSLNIFNNITILLFVPLFDRFVYPFLARRDIHLSMRRKMLIGFAFALLAMLTSGVVEVFRLQLAPPAGGYLSPARNNISPCRNIDNYNPYKYQEYYEGLTSAKPSNCRIVISSACPSLPDSDSLPLECIQCDDIPQMSGLSVFAQIPQFVLIGVSEIFASITSLEFFFSQAPLQMRSVSQALNLLTSALGSWLTIPLTLIVNLGAHKWITTDIDTGHLDWYFFLLACLQGGVIVFYLAITSGFQPVDPTLLLELSQTDDKDGRQP